MVTIIMMKKDMECNLVYSIQYIVYSKEKRRSQD